MTELELYKYITDNGIEWRWQDNEGKQDVIIFPYIFHLEDFCKLVNDYLPEGGLQVQIMGNYAAVWMNDLCENAGIEIEKVFPVEEN